jgi:hypothetical protein
MSTTLSTSLDRVAAVQSAPLSAPPNNFLANMVEAIETYPQTYLTLEIYEVDPPGSGTAINEGEDVTFKVHVHNSGPLNVNQLTLLIEAQAGADGVMLHGGKAFNPSLISTPIDQIPAHQMDGDWIDPPDGHYHFKAGSATGGKVDLVRVSINTWDTDFNHPLLAHSDPVPSDNIVFSANVLRA